MLIYYNNNNSECAGICITNLNLNNRYINIKKLEFVPMR